jgi:uncharacterized repeat protein (TIGR03837 family)
MKHWDIFCKIVDNFGDIGVCWRLARQLNTEHNITIRLWIDDLTIAQKLIPALDLTQSKQTIENITIYAWHKDTVFNEPVDESLAHASEAEAVIEAFGCELPAAYLNNMQPRTIWVNLEYLSAEPWVEDFHARNSKCGNLTRHFFFPGFNMGTGGLLREHNIVKENQEITEHAEHFLKHLNLDDDSRLKVSLFCYPHASIKDLLNVMAESNIAIDCLMPMSNIMPKVADFFNISSIKVGDTLSNGNLRLQVLPFLSQTDYDKLLAACDINFVRGEDSWIRAIWAGKPLIWQPYRQTEDTHITKLKAFLDLFYANCEEAAKQSIYEIQNAWASGEISASLWINYLQQLSILKVHTLQQSKSLAMQSDLATNLVIFIEKLHHNKI